MQKTFHLVDEQATKRFAKQLSQFISKPFVFYLLGDLGAGKTTIVRYFIKSLGYQGAVKSPTYTLVESYQCAEQLIYHFDLYRLITPDELAFMGIRDYFVEPAIHFIEWPTKGAGYLPSADIECRISLAENSARVVTLIAHSQAGKDLLERIADL